MAEFPLSLKNMNSVSPSLDTTSCGALEITPRGIMCSTGHSVTRSEESSYNFPVSPPPASIPLSARTVRNKRPRDGAQESSHDAQGSLHTEKKGKVRSESDEQVEAANFLLALKETHSPRHDTLSSSLIPPEASRITSSSSTDLKKIDERSNLLLAQFKGLFSQASELCDAGAAAHLLRQIHPTSSSTSSLAKDLSLQAQPTPSSTSSLSSSVPPRSSPILKRGKPVWDEDQCLKFEEFARNKSKTGMTWKEIAEHFPGEKRDLRQVWEKKSYRKKRIVMAEYEPGHDQAIYKGLLKYKDSSLKMLPMMRKIIEDNGELLKSFTASQLRDHWNILKDKEGYSLETEDPSTGSPEATSEPKQDNDSLSVRSES